MKKALLAIALITALATAAAQNVTEVKIDSIPLMVKSGTSLEFTYTVGNREGEPCNAEIRYWIGSIEPRQSQGTDTVYLSEKEVKQANGSLLIPSAMKGIQDFYLEMACNGTTAVANKTIEVKETVPTLTQFTALEIREGREGKQLEFSYQIKSSREETIAVRIEETLEKNGTLAWQNTQNLAVSGEAQATSLGPVLQPGNYKLTVHASHGSETSKISREFSAAEEQTQIPIIPSLAIAGIAAAALAGTFLASRKIRAVPKHPAKAGIKTKKPAEEKACVAESESSGTPDNLAIEAYLDGVGLKGKEREKAVLLAESTPITQIAKSSIVKKKGKIGCETTVSMTISNNTNRNWNKLTLLAELPEFLAEDISAIESNCEIYAIKGTHIVAFLIPKVGAMKSETAWYKAGKTITQEEANSVQLPAVIDYSPGKPLTITQVRVETAKEKAPKKAKAAKGRKKRH